MQQDRRRRLIAPGAEPGQPPDRPRNASARSHSQEREFSVSDQHQRQHQRQQTFVGIDVSKARLDVCCLPDDQQRESFAADNTPGGVASLAGRLRAHEVALVVIESTGRYERRCAAELMDAGLEVAIVNPRRPRDFARATGQLAKSDAIDAFVLAQFAKVIGPRPSEKPRENQLLLDELVARRRRQVVQMLPPASGCASSRRSTSGSSRASAR